VFPAILPKPRKRNLISQERLKQLLVYDPLSGVFTWIKRNGNIAGSVMNKGYITICVDKRQYLAHRLAVLYMTGEFPKELVDHINCCKTDNRWENLRCVSKKVNNENRQSAYKGTKTGYLGVSLTASNKFAASIRDNWTKTYLGSFETAKEAYDAYVAEKRIRHEGSML